MNKLISFLQVWGIVLVVAGHLMGGDGDLGGYGWVNTWIYSFHMPLFMFISGWLMRYADVQSRKFRPFISKKARRLLIPYLVISSMAYLPKVAMNQYALREAELSISGYIHSLIYPWDNAIVFLWFLPTLFIVFIIAFHAVKYLGGGYAMALLMIVGAIFSINDWQITPLLNLTGVVHYFMWFGAGFLFAGSQAKIVRMLRLESPWVCCALFLLTIVQLFWPIVILNAVIGILFSISLGYQYINRGWRMLDHLFGYSFSIFLLSWFPQVAVRIAGFQILALPWWAVWPVSIGLGIYIPYLIARLIKTKFQNRKLLKTIVGI